MAIFTEALMSDQLRHQTLSQPAPSEVEPELGLIAPVAGRQQRLWYQAQQRFREYRLSDLQQYICELLIKNQQLRWSLESERNNLECFC